MKKLFRGLGGVVGLLALWVVPASAWDSYGHMMVGHVAYQQLNPKAKAVVDQLAAEVRFPGTTYTFVTLGCWMDDIRADSPDIPFTGQFKPWHYISWGHEPTDSNPPLELGDDEESKQGNIIIGLKRALAVLKGGSDLEIPDQAHALAILSHLVGDVHQPLHCGSRYFVDRNGRTVHDAGGNRVMLENGADVTLPLGNTSKTNLHAFWDQAYRARFDSKANRLLADPAYDDYNKKDMELLAAVLVGLDRYAPEPDVSLEPDFVAWAREGNALAKNFAYANLPRFERDRYADIDDLYTLKAVELAKGRIVLAGYRLAHLLNAILGQE